MKNLICVFLISVSISFARAQTPLPASHYAYAPSEVATDRGRIIDLDLENEKAFNTYFNTSSQDAIFLIVPGYVNKSVRERRARLDPLAIERLKLALHYYYQNPNDSFFILTGGNVWPNGTQYNESREMKRYLMDVHLIPENRIMIEPYARNSVTNLRNVGRLILALGGTKGRIITSRAQRFYFGSPYLSTMAIRSYRMLGGMPGDTWFMTRQIVGFTPYKRVFNHGKDELDP